jgi:hypothetical protein
LKYTFKETNVTKLKPSTRLTQQNVNKVRQEKYKEEKDKGKDGTKTRQRQDKITQDSTQDETRQGNAVQQQTVRLRLPSDVSIAVLPCDVL